MGRLLIKPGVDFGASLAPAGARILEVLKKVAVEIDFDLVITSANDSVHATGSAHYTNEAFDIRTKSLTPPQKRLLLETLRLALYHEPRRFYVIQEDLGGPQEHIHLQKRLGTTYSVYDYLANL